MDYLNTFLFGVYSPLAYIIVNCLFRKISTSKLIGVAILIALIIVNWLYVGRLQNSQTIGIAVAALYIFPPQKSDYKYIYFFGIFLVIGLLLNSKLLYESTTRSHILFGSNTDAALVLTMLLPLMLSKTYLIRALYVFLGSLIIFTTQSRSALLLIFPMVISLLPIVRTRVYLPFNKKQGLWLAYTTYIVVTIFVFYIYQNMEIMYSFVEFGRESRQYLLSMASDMDRLEAFLAAQDSSFSTVVTFFMGVDIYPKTINTFNVVHSEMFSLLFGGGLILFIFTSILLVNSVFYVTNIFSLMYVTCFILAAGFSTTLFSFPFLYIVSGFLKRMDLVLIKGHLHS